MQTQDGAELALEPGRQVVARVVDVSADGSARISLAGQLLAVQASAQLRPGDEIRLSVTQADQSGVRMSLVPTPPPTSANAPAVIPTIPAATAATAATPAPPHGVAAIIGELAKAGVPVAPAIANAVARVVEQLGGGGDSARAVAQLAGRDLVLSSAAATRVAAALDVAGSIGPALESLAARSTTIAQALPQSTPGAAALRAVLAPSLEPTELAVARIVQATQAARSSIGAGDTARSAGAVALATPAAPSDVDAATMLRSYAATRVNATTVAPSSAALADAARAAATGATPPPAVAAQTPATSTPATPTPGTATPAASAPAPAPITPPAGAPASLAQQSAKAAIVGTGAADPMALGIANIANDDDAAGAATMRLATQSPAPATAARLDTPSSAPRPVTVATAAAATGAAAATVSPTEPKVAQAVADLASIASRVVTSTAPAAGAVAETATAAARGANAADIAQRAGAAGGAGTASASHAGSSASGDPAPVVTAVQQFLASGGSQSDAAQLTRALQGATTAAVRDALQQLPEQQSLQLAGALLERMGGAEHERAAIHRALDDLGRALRPPPDAGNELAHLRAALEQVASGETRSTVAHDAARLLGALDGQQILSRTQTGADAGFLYFQVPLPDGRGAEVMVRREPGRREVTFDEFDIAFLLDTEQLGTLMIHLDAQPTGIRADVKTNLPALEGYLADQSAALVEPLAREGRRPVTVTVGSFDHEPPASLLEPTFGAIAPGATEFYV